MGWTDERVELLKRLWAEGLSASQIARELGGVTRNAVIGKVHRLGLHASAPRTRARVMRQAAPRAPRSRRAFNPGDIGRAAVPRPLFSERAPAVVVEDPHPGGAVTFDELQPHHCRWPFGDPRSGLRYCGAAKIACTDPTLPLPPWYCGVHFGRSAR